MKEQASLAITHYEQGNLFADQKRFHEAIESYSKALEYFPIFMEALDNRGLAKMDLGNFREAVKDFQQSLAMHGPNRIPLCSMGECHLKLNEPVEAERAFDECRKRWPDEPQFLKYYLMAQLMSNVNRSRNGNVDVQGKSIQKKPWWRFWS
jgi:tetratricopeptide (TPR) repeat protein